MEFLEKQTAHLRQIIQRSKYLENEQNDRMKTLEIQYELGRKHLNTLTDIHQRTDKKLTAVELNENQIKQDIENTKSQITQGLCFTET